MRPLRALWNRVRALLERENLEAEMEEEIAFHLEREVEKYVAQGMSEAEARRRARVAFGGVDRHKEQVRRSWGTGLLFDLAGDVRFALRQIRRYPAFSAVGVLTLALGIGGTVALASVAHGILLRPLPVAEEDRLVVFWYDYSWRGVEFDYLKDRTRTFEGLAAYSNNAYTLRTGEGASSYLQATVASAELFDVLDVRPQMGRAFQPGDDRPGSEPVVVISHGLWQERFGADPGVLGRQVYLGGESTTIVGVMPEGFYFPTPDWDAWVPLDMDPASGRYQNNGWLVVVGRLKEGITGAQMQADLDAMAGLLRERFTYPAAWDKTENPFAHPLRDYLLGDVRPAVLLLLGAVGLLLLMACANVAALILTRSADRATEMSVRSSLGAGRGRLARQVVTESVTLGLLGAAAGLMLSFAVFDLLVAALPLHQGFQRTLSMDGTTMAAALVLAIGTGALISLAPVRSLLSGGSIAGSLRQRSEGGVGGRSSRMQGVLVVGEVLLAVVLVTGAALLVRSVDRLRAIDPGLDERDVLAADFFIGSEEASDEERATLFREVTERASVLPGVRSAGLINRLPIRDGGYQGTITVEDRPDLSGILKPNSAFRVVTPETFAALDFQLVEGRGIEPTDTADSRQVAVVNETFSEKMWPGESALGRRIGAALSLRNEEFFEVVGVVRNVAVHDLVSEAPMAAYYSWDQVYIPDFAVLVVEAERRPADLTEGVRTMISGTDPRVAVGRIETMQQVVDHGMEQNLRLRFFLTLFSVLALVLGTVGVYGVASYAVERRRVEFGVRSALGAGPEQLLGTALRIGMLPVGLGVLAGAAAALGLSRVLDHFLYEVSTRDPAAFLAGAGVLLIAGLVSALIPAVRASRSDPASALRAD